MMKTYWMTNGTYRIYPLKLIAMYDMLTPHYMEHVIDKVFDDMSITDAEFNRELIDILRNSWSFGFDCWSQTIHYHHRNFIYYDVSDDYIHALVMGHEDKILVSQFADLYAKERFNQKMLKYRDWLNEMARNVGDSLSHLENAEKRKISFDRFKDDPVVKNINFEILLHKYEDGNATEYSTNDHKLGETLHRSKIIQHKSSVKFPYHNITQDEVERYKDANLPRGYATTVAYDHFKSQHLPLKSSRLQHVDGHKMWHRLVDKALSDSHHVYHYDGSGLHKTTEQNKAEHLANSFGLDDKFENRHMVLSKNELT